MKKTLKILLLSLLAVVCAVCFFACDGGKKEESAGLKITKRTGDDFYTVYGYVEDPEVSVVDIAEMAIVDGNKVEIGRISSGAFKSAAHVKELIVPDTVVEIDEGAFAGMRALEKLSVPFIGKTANADAFYRESADSDKSVNMQRTFGWFFGTDTFDYSTEVTVTYSEGNTETRYMPLSLKTVNVLPNADYSVPMYAFYGNPLITGVTLSANVTAIGEYAFAECSVLKRVETIADLIYSGAFKNCVSLSTFNFKAGSDIGEKAFYGTSALKTVTIPEDVILGVNCFENSGLTDLTLYAESIPAYCFYNCVSLKTVTVNGLNEIGTAAFAYCTALNSFNSADDATVDLTGITASLRAFAYLTEKEYKVIYSGFNADEVFFNSTYTIDN